MKIIYILLVSVCSLSMLASADDSQEKTIASTFKVALAKTVSVENGTLTVVTKDSGTRFLLSVDDRPQRVLKYSEKVILPRGFRRATFAERHYSITIAIIDGTKDKYEISEKFDNRSFGGDVVTTTKEFSLDDASLASEQR